MKWCCMLGIRVLSLCSLEFVSSVLDRYEEYSFTQTGYLRCLTWHLARTFERCLSVVRIWSSLHGILELSWEPVSVRMSAFASGHQSLKMVFRWWKLCCVCEITFLLQFLLSHWSTYYLYLWGCFLELWTSNLWLGDQFYTKSSAR